MARRPSLVVPPVWEPPSIVFQRRCQGEGRYPPSYEVARVLRQPLREVVIRQGLLGDVVVPEEEAVQGPEVVEEAQQGGKDQSGQEDEAEEDGGGHVAEPQPLEHCQGEEGNRDDLKRNEDQQPDARCEDTALPGFAVSQVGHGQPMEIIEAVV